MEDNIISENSKLDTFAQKHKKSIWITHELPIMTCNKLISSIIDPIRKHLCLSGSPETEYSFTPNWSGDGPGFTDEFVKIMYKNFRENLNIQGSGAVVAAPDTDTPGGSYFYHWMRDAGLTMKSWMELHDDDYNSVKDILDAYVDWVTKVQKKYDPNNIDVRIEPKFEIPSGDPYTGEWGRPQTDGPALRSMALTHWGMILIDSGRAEEAKSKVWPLIRFDLEWVVQNWKSNGFDLWEEVQSDNFYFNRMSFVYSLNKAAILAENLKIEKAVIDTFKTTAKIIEKSAKSHWNGKFIYESKNRLRDGSVVLAIATFGSYQFGPNSREAVSTIKVLCETFYNEYDINQTMNEKHIPGILIGRYPGDHYAGGNPWQLLTAILAECFYLAAEEIVDSLETDGKIKGNDLANNPWTNFLMKDSYQSRIVLISFIYTKS